MKPRINKKPIIVASTSKDPKIQALCKFNLNNMLKDLRKKSTIMTVFGIKKTFNKNDLLRYNQ